VFRFRVSYVPYLQDMSLLWFALSLKVTLAIYIGSKPVPEGALPGEVLDLEAAVLAKYSNGLTGGSILSTSAAHAQPVAGMPSKISLTRAKGSSELTCQAPVEIFDFEKVLLDRNSMSKAEPSFLRVQPKGSSTHAAQKDVAPEIAEIGADVLGSSKAGLKLQTARLSGVAQAQPRVKLQSKRELGASVAPPEVPLEVANLEAAVLAKYGANDESVKVQDEAQQAGAQPEVPLEVAKLEAAVLAKYASDDVTSKQQADAPPAAAQPDVPSDVAKLEADVLAKYATNGLTPNAQAENVHVQSPPPDAKQLEAAALAKYATDDAADMAKYVVNGQSSASPAESPHAHASTADVAKLEAAVLKKYAASDETLLQGGVTMKSNLKQNAARDELAQEVPAQRSIARLVFYVMAVSGLVVCAYQKSQLIMETMKGNSEPPQRQSKWEGSYDYSV